ncbi:PREDICTED: protein TRM32-like [Ipomoea nil]|uniref:protein TRM32-like n=1 Tax=Ipomoea nil TaxID=35883 RepID=UPI0009011DFB|nr:PREDICTED: protein TRM32-like [Ipomoea nil]
MEDPDWMRFRKDDGRGGGSMWRRFKHALGYYGARKKFLKRRTKLVSNDPDESLKLLDYKHGHMNGSESGKGNSWSDQLNYNANSRLMKSGSYPPPGSKRRGGYKPSALKEKEIEVWVSVNSGTEESCRNVRTGLEKLRSTTSLDDSSADKYTRLFGPSFGKEKVLQTCKSLSVRKELEIPFLPLRRIRSVSSAESINLHQVESPRSSSFAHHYLLSVPEEGSASLVGEKPGRSREKIESIDDVFEELIVLDKSDSSGGEEDFINLFPSDIEQVSAASKISEGSEDDFVINSNESLNTGSLSLQKFETTKKPSHTNPDISYIMHLLENSGLTTLNLFLREQPLMSPSLFKEIEALWHEEGEECCHHRMLFDLANEVLVHMCDRSLTYYPKALSSWCRVRSLPPENRVSEVVCGSISSWLRLSDEVKKTTDGVVGHDLEKDDGWMNLQLDSEDVALELEDMTFDDVLDELIFDDLLEEFFDVKL